MSLTLTKPASPSLWQRFCILLRRYFLVKELRYELKRINGNTQRLTDSLHVTVQANKSMGKTLDELRERNKELERQLLQFAIVDPNAKCPFCGAMEGEINTIQDFISQSAFIVHTCKVCKGKFPEQTVLKDAGKIWAPAPPEGIKNG